MRGIQFGILQYISQHIEMKCEFYRELPDLTKEEALQIYTQLKVKETSDNMPLVTQSGSVGIV